VKDAEVRRFKEKTKAGGIREQTNIDWVKTTGTAEVRNIQRFSVALWDDGSLFYTSGFGWGALFHDYKSFHERVMARTVSVGTPEVTAKVTTLEDLGDVPREFFDAGAAGGDAKPLRTEYIDELTLRKNLLPSEPVVWPPVKDGPMEGNVTTWIVVDREGKVRDIGTMVAENASMNDAGKAAVANLRFQPFLVNGAPVQVMSQITTPFETTRPAGAEVFESARTYFECGGQVGFPAAGNASPIYCVRSSN
jgi:hypothetical protein